MLDSIVIDEQNKVKEEHVTPFLEATKSVFKMTTNIDVELGDVYVKESPFASETLAIILGLTGDIRGQVIFSMKANTAMHVASMMMFGMPVSQLDEMAYSAISELTNMIMGNSATIFYKSGIHVDITPPTLLMGDNMTIHNKRLKTICFPAKLSDEHVFEVDISIEQE